MAVQILICSHGKGSMSIYIDHQVTIKSGDLFSSYSLNGGNSRNRYFSVVVWWISGHDDAAGNKKAGGEANVLAAQTETTISMFISCAELLCGRLLPYRCTQPKPQDLPHHILRIVLVLDFLLVPLLLTATTTWQMMWRSVEQPYMSVRLVILIDAALSANLPPPFKTDSDRGACCLTWMRRLS